LEPVSRFSILALLCVASTPALADEHEILSLEAGATAGVPRSSIRFVDPGVGVQLVGAATVYEAKPRSLALIVGYRRFWTHDDDTRVWTDDVMAGVRLQYALTNRWRALAQLNAAYVRLDSRMPDGMIDSTYHHTGWGGGARVGASYQLVDRVHAVLGVGGSYAETKYEDAMGVAWLSFDAAVMGVL
jgi:hypothetical protein